MRLYQLAQFALALQLELLLLASRKLLVLQRLLFLLLERASEVPYLNALPYQPFCRGHPAPAFLCTSPLPPAAPSASVFVLLYQ
jgi:hypothetical protein